MKKLGIIRILVAFFLIQGASPVDANNAPIRLQLKLQEGDSYYMETVRETVYEKIPGPAPMFPERIKYKTETAYEVQEVDSKGNMTIKVTHLSVLYDEELFAIPGTQEPTTRHIYDSTNPPATDEPIPMAVVSEAASVGQSITMTIAQNGTVKEVKGMEPIRAKAEEYIDNLPRTDDKTKAQWKKMLTSKITNEYAKELWPKKLHVKTYPDHPVKVGDTWKVQYDLGDSNFESHFTLRDLRNGIAFIEEKTVVRNGKSWDKHEGVIEIDEKTGWIQKMDFHIEGYHYHSLSGQTYLFYKSKFHVGPIAGR